MAKGDEEGDESEQDPAAANDAAFDGPGGSGKEQRVAKRVRAMKKPAAAPGGPAQWNLSDSD